MPTTGHASVEQTFRLEFGRAVASLVRLFGDIDLAEEAVQQAFVVALQRWPTTGIPPNPGGWIVTTARNQAIDRFRREASRHDRQAQAALVHHRDVIPSERSTDVRFDDFMADELGIAERVYDLAGEPLTNATRTAMADYLQGHQRGRLGQIATSAEMFGLDEHDLPVRFARYRERFSV